MKTLEEKAKAYDEAIERAKKLHETCDSQAVVGWCEYIFPKLCESEDEKVREDIISLVNEFWERIGSINPEYSSRSRMLAWLEKQGTSYTKRDVDDAYVEGIAFAKNELEKQGEQKPIDKIQLGKKYKCIASPRYSTFRRGNIYKPVDNFLCNLMNLCYECFEPIEDSEQKSSDKVEPKFKVGDWVIDDKNRVGIIVRILDEHYIISFDGREVQISFEWEGKLFRKWSIKDAKDGDVLYMNNGLSTCTFIYKSIDNVIIQKYASYNKFGFEGTTYLVLNDGYVCPATKEQRDTLFAKMKEFGYEWDFEKKELMKIEDEEYNGEDYGIDSLFHAQRILEKTLGSVDGYETDDGILSHQCAITAVKKLYEQKPTWSDEDVYNSKLILSTINQDQDLSLKTKDKLTSWIKSIKQRIGI